MVANTKNHQYRGAGTCLINTVLYDLGRLAGS